MAQLLDHDPSSDGVFDRTKRKAVLLQARTRQRESQLPSATRAHLRSADDLHATTTFAVSGGCLRWVSRAISSGAAAQLRDHAHRQAGISTRHLEPGRVFDWRAG